MKLFEALSPPRNVTAITIKPVPHGRIAKGQSNRIVSILRCRSVVTMAVSSRTNRYISVDVPCFDESQPLSLPEHQVR